MKHLLDKKKVKTAWGKKDKSHNYCSKKSKQEIIR